MEKIFSFEDDEEDWSDNEDEGEDDWDSDEDDGGEEE
jgi:hypothetical protein